MQYEKPPFPYGLIACSIIFILIDLYAFYAYSVGEHLDNGMLLSITITLTVLAVGFLIYTISTFVEYYGIIALMRDDKYIICRDFKHEIELDDNNAETISYSVTVAEIIDSNGKTRKLKSKKYPINHNPFGDGRTEIKIFIDIDKHYSPYYFYPYSEN